MDRLEIIYFQKSAYDRHREPEITPKRLLLQECGPLPPEWEAAEDARWS